MRFKALALFAVLVGSTSIASCNESLDAGGACPLLCPQEEAPLKDTTLDAVTLDSSIAAFPALGFEQLLLVAKRGDTLDARAVIRFDSLPVEFTTPQGTGPLIRLDSAYLRGVVPLADTGVVLSQDGILEAYDVTNADNDTASASIEAEMTPDHLLGTLELSAGMSPDTITIILDNGAVLSRVADGQSLRIGLRMVTAGSAQIRLVSQQFGNGVSLVLHPDRDPEVPPVTFASRSATPTNLARLRTAFGDFSFVTVGALSSVGSGLRVGGFPARRVLLRFNIPPRIVDSAIVVRATLFLTQRPSSAAQAGDTAVVRIAPIVVSSQVTDLYEMLQFAGSPQDFPVDSVVLIPKDSATRAFQIVNLVRNWRGQDTIKTPRVVALSIRSEADRASGVDFFSMEAPAEVRPRLRITYVSRIPTGRP